MDKTSDLIRNQLTSEICRRRLQYVMTSVVRLVPSSFRHKFDFEQIANDVLYDLASREWNDGEPKILDDACERRLCNSIIRCKVIDHARYLTQDKRDCRTVSIDQQPEPCSCDEKPETRIENQELLNDWLDFLDPVGARIVMLRYDGLKNHEVAKQLGLSIRTIERNLNQNRKLFAKQNVPPPIMTIEGFRYDLSRLMSQIS